MNSIDCTLNKELDAIINSSSDGLFVCDSQGIVIRMNPASEKIHQVKARKIIGRNIRDLVENGFIDRSAALEASISKKKISLLQCKYNKKLMSIATPVLDDDGEILRIVVSERDITEIDRLQRELEEKDALNNRFRHKILEMQSIEIEARRVIAKSPPMILALEQAIKVSKVESSVLILGESGVGKGMIADLIYNHSKRKNFPLIKINCGAIPESLIEAELFGHEKGAFTGALENGKPGYLELADNGILFLDEIAELPLSSQVKLLKILEDGKVARLGSSQERKVNVRIIAATHRDLEGMIKDRLFRHDLYYRLNVVPIYIPSVRERRECIIPLLRHYIEYFGKINGINKRISGKALDILESYSYPGNVRELMNICERLVVMTDSELIDPSDLPSQINTIENQEISELSTDWINGKTLAEVIEFAEKHCLINATRKFTNQYKIARYLNVNQSTIARKLKKYSLN